MTRFATVRLDPERQASVQATRALTRFASFLRDEGWDVQQKGPTLHATKHRGVFYGTASPLARATRGALTCAWAGPRLVLRFRPDWIAALIDLAIIAVAYGMLTGVVPGTRWFDTTVAFVTLSATLLTLMPLVRFRFVALLARAVWLSDEAWERLRRRAGFWRWAWVIAPALWLGSAVYRWLLIYARLSLGTAQAVYRHQPLWAALVLLAALGGGAVLGITYLFSSSKSTTPGRD